MKHASLHQTRLDTAWAGKLPKISVCIGISLTAPSILLHTELLCHIPPLHLCCTHSVRAEGFPLRYALRGAAMPAVGGKFCNARSLQLYLSFSTLLQIMVPIYKDSESLHISTVTRSPPMATSSSNLFKSTLRMKQPRKPPPDMSLNTHSPRGPGST